MFTVFKPSFLHLQNRSLLYVNRFRASPLGSGDVVVPAMSFSAVFLLLSKSLETLFHRSVNSAVPAAESDIVQ